MLKYNERKLIAAATKRFIKRGGAIVECPVQCAGGVTWNKPYTEAAAKYARDYMAVKDKGREEQVAA